MISRPGRGDNDSNNSSNNNSSVSRALSERVKNLGFASFQTLVVLWLGANGYSHMRSLGRFAQRGRRAIGGADFLARVPRSSHLRVAIQIRHSKTPVQRRAVDELRGFMLRFGIPTGVIVTNTRFHSAAITAATEFAGRPIGLVPGVVLASCVLALAGRESGWDRVGSSSRQLFNLVDKLRLSPMLNRSQERGVVTKDNRKAGHGWADESLTPDCGFGSPSPECYWRLVIVGALLTLLAVLVGAALH